MIQPPIYVDNHATTPADVRVVTQMLPFFTDKFGNTGSRHHYGFEAKQAVNNARGEVARLIQSNDSEVVFTSGATESNNLAIKGVARGYKDKGSHIVTAATEHKSVLDPCKHLETDGFQVTYLPVDRYGQVSVDQLADALTDKTILVSLMIANNEIGTVQPIKSIAMLCREREIVLHTDAVQAAGKLVIDVDELGVDLLSLSAHKMYGPKGVGALYVRGTERARVRPIIEGGGQEGGLRSGTLSVPHIVGFGKACEICREEIGEESRRLTQLRDRLHHGLLARVQGVSLNGHPTQRLPGNLNLSFDLVDGESLIMSMTSIAVSSGSACSSSKAGPSHVLKALGLSDDLAQGTLRFGIGRFNTEEEVDFVIEEVTRAVQAVREANPLYSLLSRV